MSTIINKEIFTVPEYGNSISLFIKKLHLAQYAEGTIINYCYHIPKAVEYFKRTPDDFTEADVDDYLLMLLNHLRHYSLSYFRHTVFGLKYYYKFMDLTEPKGLVLPNVRKEKKMIWGHYIPNFIS